MLSHSPADLLPLGSCANDRHVLGVFRSLQTRPQAAGLCIILRGCVRGSGAAPPGRSQAVQTSARAPQGSATARPG
eukprot:3018324-Lingulodinium_polyedra.AAC.1